MIPNPNGPVEPDDKWVNVGLGWWLSDATFLVISHGDDAKFRLLDLKNTTGFEIISTHDTLEAAKVAYIMHRSTQ
jgi:hypothetical protein